MLSNAKHFRQKIANVHFFITFLTLNVYKKTLSDLEVLIFVFNFAVRKNKYKYKKLHKNRPRYGKD